MGIYTYFSVHPEEAVRKHMCDWIKKRWQDCDQPLFILAPVLNLYEGLLAFREHAGLNLFNLQNMLISVGQLLL
jgi:hypothetical protein